MTVLLPGITETDLKKICLSIQQLGAGRSNAVGTVTLTPSNTITTVTDDNIAAGSVPILVATTANAAAEIGNGTLYISTVVNNAFNITHANAVSADRTFLYAVVG